MAWTSSGTYLEMTDKEQVIAKIEEQLELDDDTCVALKKLKIEELNALLGKVTKSLDTAFAQGKEAAKEDQS